MGICVIIFTNEIDMEMKQLPVLSSVGDILMDQQLRGNQVRILNSRAAVCVQPDFVIHCMLCEKEKSGVTA